MDEPRKRVRPARAAASGASGNVPVAPPPQNLAKTPKRTTSSASEEASMDERLGILRRNAPILYDSFLHHNLQWGSLSVAWGGEAPESNRVMLDNANFPEEYNVEQTIYYAGRTDGAFDASARTWSGSPGELFVGRVALAKPRTVPRTSVGKFQENNRSSRVNVYKRLIHPGEVNRIRALPAAPHMIATHTESPVVFIWNTTTQPHRTENLSEDGKAMEKTSASTSSFGSANGGGGRKKSASWVDPCKCSVPDLELVGHKLPAEYALDTKATSKVLSGGSDKLVLLWSLEDSVNDKNQVEPRRIFEGHKAPVEDCSFCPIASNEDLCCSVGQDRSLFIWDSRSDRPAEKCEEIHDADANCCSWSASNLILTGGSDRIVNIFDTRKLNQPLTRIEQRESVINVRWSPDDPQVFAISDEAANLTLYRMDPSMKKAEVFFQHLGHRTSVVDVQFDPIQPWVLASVSDDSADEARGGGGTLQIWRISEFIHKSMKDKEWVNEVDQMLTKSMKLAPSQLSEDESGDE